MRRALNGGVWLSVFVAMGIAPSPALAIDYGLPMQVRDAEDLEELHASGTIDDETFEALYDLIAEGVDLNRVTRDDAYLLPSLSYEDAERIVAYRETSGPIDDPSELVGAGVLTASQLESMRAFLITAQPESRRERISGRVRLRTAWSPADHEAPTSALELRFGLPGGFRAGFAAVSTRQRLRRVAWEPQPWFVVDEYGRQGVLTAAAPTYEVHAPKYFVGIERQRWGAVLGTYTIGFGQRLTFDSSSRSAPHGYYGDVSVAGPTGMVSKCKEAGGEPSSGLGASPCAGGRRYERALADYRWTERQRGIAARIEPLSGQADDSGPSLFLWASTQARSVYQYDIYHTELCPDPRTGDPDLCRAPQVYRSPIRIGESTTRFKQHQLPALVTERLVGANASYFFRRRAHIGGTAYAADMQWGPGAGVLDFAPIARYPAGGAFGAGGVDAAWGREWFDVFLEGAKSFTEAGGMGGGALLLRAVAAWGRGELEWSGRYYGEQYENPYARAIAAADETDGLRVRDELGTRLRYGGEFAGRRLELAARADSWVQLSTNRPKLVASVRSDYWVTPSLRPGLGVELRSKDLTDFGRGDCYEGVNEDEESSEEPACRGEKIRVSSRIRAESGPRWNFVIEYAHDWRSDPSSERGFARDQLVRLHLALLPVKVCRLSARLRLLDEYVGNNDRGEQSLWASGEVSVEPSAHSEVALRYDAIDYLDERASTLARTPKLEHWGRIDWTQKF